MLEQIKNAILVIATALLYSQIVSPSFASDLVVPPFGNHNSAHAADVADDSVATMEQINRFSNEILLCEIQLQKTNTLFRLQSTSQPKWRAWRQFLYSEANSGLTTAGLIGRMFLSYPYTNEQSGRPNGKLVQACATASLVGQFVAAAGESYELTTNLRSYRRAETNALDAKSYSKWIVRQIENLDTLFARRDKCIAQASLCANDLAFINCETLLLQDLKHISLFEYIDYRSGARKLKFFQNVAYLTSISKNLIGAGSSILSIQATRLSDNNLSGDAALLNTIAGALVIASPVVGRVSGNMAGLIDRRIASKHFFNLEKQELETFAKHRRQLELSASKKLTVESLLEEEKNRLEVYSMQQGLLHAQQTETSRELRRAKNTTLENVMAGTAVGSSRMAAGVLGMIGAWKYSDSAWMASRCTAAAATAYSAGTSFNILETARVRISQQSTDRRDAASGSTFQQVMQKKLAMLNSMNNMLMTKGVMASAPSEVLK